MIIACDGKAAGAQGRLVHVAVVQCQDDLGYIIIQCHFSHLFSANGVVAIAGNRGQQFENQCFHTFAKVVPDRRQCDRGGILTGGDVDIPGGVAVALQVEVGKIGVVSRTTGEFDEYVDRFCRVSIA